ncbi:EamA family transporter [Flavobacterium sp.]|uniref:EamA family transporter n=1 Tax=Flavobacterium sp. TaxID=239 RepID=UPI003753B83A
MLYVVFSIICSVLVGVLLKIVKKNNLSFYQIITWNYVFALILTHFAYQPEFKTHFSISTGLILVTLCFLLPIIFIFQAKAIQYNGIVKTDIAQRLSLFISILASYFIFKEAFNYYKLIGLLFAFSAIDFTLYKENQKVIKEKNKWHFLLLVLLGFGTIDVLFKQISVLSEIKFTEVLFLIFIGSLIASAIISTYYIVKEKEKFDLKNALWGLGVGVLNFGNISLYIKAHQALSENPSTVFAGMNMGVILLGSCVGIIIFKEKLSKINYAGILLAIISILFITYSQMKQL